MALENVRLSDRNACTDRSHSYIASCNNSYQAIIEVDKNTGTIHKSWPLDTLVSEVYSIEFDGYYWWTLEQQTGGCIIRKWRPEDNIYARLINTFYYTGHSDLPEALAVEHYYTTLSFGAYKNDTYLYVEDFSKFRVSDYLIVGPSTEVGYVGNYDERQIIEIDEVNSRIQVTPAISNNYGGGVRVYTTRAFWIFFKGELFKYSPKTGNYLASDTDLLYEGIKAATFFSDKILFVKSSDIYWLDPDSLNLFKVMAVNNLKADRSTILSIYDLYGYGDYVYRLQGQTAYLSGDTWLDTSWTTYNTVSSKTIPEVYMVSLNSSARVLPALDPPEITTTSATITCQVYDQYFSPVTSKTVNFTTDAGVLLPDQAITDTNGECSITYIGDAQIKLITITAETI